MEMNFRKGMCLTVCSVASFSFVWASLGSRGCFHYGWFPVFVMGFISSFALWVLFFWELGAYRFFFEALCQYKPSTTLGTQINALSLTRSCPLKAELQLGCMLMYYLHEKLCIWKKKAKEKVQKKCLYTLNIYREKNAIGLQLYNSPFFYLL